MSVKKKVNLFEHCSVAVNCFVRNDSVEPEFVVNYSNCTRISSQQLVCAAYSALTDTHFVCSTTYINTSDDGTDFDCYWGYFCENYFLIEDVVDDVVKPVIIGGKCAAVFDPDIGLDDIAIKEYLSCGLMHRGRLFGANEFDLWWSGPGGFTDWENGSDGCGHLSVNSEFGIVTNMLEFKGNIVIVHQFGIEILKAEGSPETFAIEPVDFNNEYIYEKTTCVVGGKLYFFTDSGLKCFDGNKITPVKLRNRVTSPWSVASYGTVYFVAGVVDGEYGVLCLDTENGESCILEERMDIIYTKNGVRGFNGGVRKWIIKSSGSAFSYKTLPLDFGTKKLKTLTKIEFEGTATITVDNGRFRRVFENVKDCVRPRMRGKTFTITVEGESRVKSATATAEVPDDI